MDLRAHLIGYPRIGPNRELKRALERAWSGRMDPDAFLGRITELRQEHLDEQHGRVLYGPTRSGVPANSSAQDRL